MKKILFIIVLIHISMGLFSSEPFYMLGDHKKGLSFTGETEFNGMALTKGKYLNEVFSPLYYDAMGLSVFYTKNRVIGRGTLFSGFDATLEMLTPHLTYDPLGLYFLYPDSQKVRLEAFVGYRFNMPIKLDGFHLSIGPYVKFDGNLAINQNISNVGQQMLFAFNLGAQLESIYRISNIARLGLNISSFIVGIDGGRSGYSKEVLYEGQFSHYGNYLDINGQLFLEADISRTESLRFIYSHAYQSVYDVSLPSVYGTNKFAITYNRKMFR